MGQYVHRLTLGVALALIGCEPALPPSVADAAAPRPPVSAPATAPVEDPAARLLREQEGVPLPSGDVAWGVSVPFGCTAVDAWPSWIGFACRPTVEEMGRYYRFRFPMAQVDVDGTALVVRPESDGTGYGRVQRVVQGANRTRLLVFRDRFEGEDEGARQIIARLRPAGFAEPDVDGRPLSP